MNSKRNFWADLVEILVALVTLPILLLATIATAVAGIVFLIIGAAPFVIIIMVIIGLLTLL